MHPSLETRRILFRPLELADAPQIQSLFPHWEIVRFLDKIVPWPYPADGASTFCQKIVLPAMARGDAWHWSLRLKTEATQLIGVISLKKRDNSNRGFWLGLPWQGQGLMTEASEAVTDYWFNELGFPELRVAKAIANTASRRISISSGMRVIATEDRDYVSGRFPSETWAITAEEWRRLRSPR